MRDLLTSLDSTRLGYYRSILEEAGIAAFIRNETTAQLVNIFIMPMQPTLCVVNDEDYEAAGALLRSHLAPDVGVFEEWVCPGCKESNPASFDLCWHCQAAKPQ